MTFEELLDMQAQLNALAATPPDQVEDIEDRLKTAIVVEVGEALQTVKADWAWWTRHGKSFESQNKTQLLGELADVFHFLLTGVLLWGKQNGFDYEAYWSNPLASNPINPKSLACVLLRQIVYYSENQNTGKAMRCFVSAVRPFGFTREELEQAYVNKAQENIMRFTQTVEAKA